MGSRQKLAKGARTRELTRLPPWGRESASLPRRADKTAANLPWAREVKETVPGPGVGKEGCDLRNLTEAAAGWGGVRGGAGREVFGRRQSLRRKLWLTLSVLAGSDPPAEMSRERI